MQPSSLSHSYSLSSSSTEGDDEFSQALAVSRTVVQFPHRKRRSRKYRLSSVRERAPNRAYCRIFAAHNLKRTFFEDLLPVLQQ